MEDYKRSSETFARRSKEINEEIEAIELTQLEKEHAIWVAKVTKWQRLRNENSDFKAKNTDDKINIVK